VHITIITRNMAAGGTERVISQLINCWCNYGIECSLILLDKSPMFYKINSNSKVYKIGKTKKNKYLDKVFKYIKIRKIIKEISPDIVLSMPEEIGIYVIGALLGTNIPVVVSERNNPWIMPYKKITRFLRKILYPFASGFIFQTNKAASFFSTTIQRKGIILPNPLDLSRILPPYSGNKENIIIGAGRLEPQKNFFMLIDAFAKVYKKHSDYKLHIYGDGSLYSKILEYANNKIPEKAFKLCGVIENLPEEISKAAVFVLSSDYEGIPNVLIEAMAGGTTVISTDCPSGGPRQLIQHRKNGLLVNVGDNDALTTALNEVIENKIKAKSMAEKALEIGQKYDARIVSRDWYKFLSNKKRIVINEKKYN